MAKESASAMKDPTFLVGTRAIQTDGLELLGYLLEQVEHFPALTYSYPYCSVINNSIALNLNLYNKGNLPL